MIGTRYPEIFAALTEEFGPREVRTRMLGNRQLSYVTARTVMNRLDSVIGPENWWDEYTPLQNGILCKLTVRLPDGEKICKSDAGGHAGMSDEGDDEKSGFSDAFKRAAVKFGIGRHLYGEGIPKFANELLTQPRPELAKAMGHINARKASASASVASSAGAPARSTKGREENTAETPVNGAGHDDALIDSGPKSTREFYELVKSLDPEGKNGIRKLLVKWGREKGYPGLIKEWSDTQAQEGYEQLKAHLEASANV